MEDGGRKQARPTQVMNSMLLKVLIAATLVSAACAGFTATSVESVTISNAKPRLDESGAVMDAHDSRFVRRDGVHHWFAASYGDCKEPAGDSGCANATVGACGFRTDHNVTLFTSNNLASWTNKGVVFTATGNLPPQSVLFAPKTVYNPKTGMWVMWFNYIVLSFDNSYYGVATASSPEGPFKLVVSQVKTLRYTDNGDENLFIDDDGTAYLVYTSLSQGHGMSVERLTPDYLGSTGESSGVIGDTFVEAPAMFKRSGIYYAVFGHCCCYCQAGSPVNVYTATDPLGPYTKRTSLGDLKSQATDIFSYVDGNGDVQFMYVGDHWQSAPDGVKGHDYTVWAPLLFSADGLSVTTAGFQDQFTVTVDSPAPTQFRGRR